MTSSDQDQAAAAIRARSGGFAPRIAIVAGSGLGAALDALQARADIPYGDIPGFPVSTVPGHAGKLLLGTLMGQPVACLSGRAHGYEGHPPARLRLPLRTMRRLGCEAAILLSTVGAINPSIRPGRLVAVSDHLNIGGFNPLAGANDEAIGPRFPSMVDAYDPKLRQHAARAAAKAGMVLVEGVMTHHPGPSFETPAEIRAYRMLGGDLVGMSMVPETTVARHCGLRVLGIGAVTNMGAGMEASGPSHDDTLAVASTLAASVAALLRALLNDWDEPL